MHLPVDMTPSTGLPVVRRRPSFLRRPAAIAALVLGLLAAAIHLLRFDDGLVATSAPPVVPALTVTTAVPRRVTWPVTLAASGAIAPWQEASIGTQIGSYRIVDVRANVGDQVRRGDVLARLDPALLRAQEAELVANAEQADANRRRAQGLQASGAISDQDVLQFVTQARTSAALLASKRLEIRYTAVLAPDDGVISARAATLGAVVPAGQELFRLIRGNRLEWRGELTAAQLAQVAQGQRVALKLPDGGDAVATVRDTAPALDAQSRLGVVYADVRPGSRARAGMYADGRIVAATAPALVVAADCIVIRDGRSYLVKLVGRTATPKVMLQAVTLGRRQGDEVEVLQGLSGSDRLVRRGAGFLADGDVVRIGASSSGARS